VHVAGQRSDPGSVLHFVRRAVALRRSSPELLEGDYRSEPVTDDCWVYRRGATTTVALNLGNARRDLPRAAVGRGVALSTHPAREGPITGTVLTLEPWEGVVITSRA
jgi:glycosidase